MQRHVDEKKLRFLAYRRHTCPENGSACFRVYCVFTNQVRVETVRRLLPCSSCTPVIGKLSYNREYGSKQASFTKLGEEPAQGKQKDPGDAEDVTSKKRKALENETTTQDLEREPEDMMSKKRKVSENETTTQNLEREPEDIMSKKRKVSSPVGGESAQGLEREPEAAEDLLKDLKKEYAISNKENKRIIDDLKKQLEASKKESSKNSTGQIDLKKQLEARDESLKKLTGQNDQLILIANQFGIFSTRTLRSTRSMAL